MSDSASSPGPAEFVPPTIEDLNTRLPQFEFIEMLGVGGMGAVYKARQPKLNRFVAIKVLPRMEDDAMGFAQRFEREAQSMAQLTHPHIASVYDFGETADGQLYFVMEYVEGADLHQLIHGSQLTSRHFFSWIPQVCAALEYAHDKGIVHRDIKPANILINKEGQVRVVDFGLAKLTSSDPKDPSQSSLTHHSLSMGTPDYAAPEQIESGSAIDGRADIYSLGVVMYQMLTGRVPRGAFRNPSLEVPGIDSRLDEVVLRAMQASPADRFQRPSEISTRLIEIQASKDSDSGGASSTAPKFNLPTAKKGKALTLATAPPKSPSTPPAPAPLSEAKPATSNTRKIGIGVAVAAVLAIVAIAAIPSGDEKSNSAKISTPPKNLAAKPKITSNKAREKGENTEKPRPMATDSLPKLPAPTPPPKLAEVKSKPTPKANDRPTKPKIDPPKFDRPEPEKPTIDNDPKERTSPPKGPDRRRRMFGDHQDYERRSHKNLTLISRSEQALDELPLTQLPADLGIVTHLVIGQAGGESKLHPPFAIARDSDGKIHTWGDSQHGELDVPEVVRSLSSSAQLSDLSAGSHHVLALDGGGKIHAWGSDEHGQCSIPTDLPPATQIAASRDFSVALLNDGTVRVWGGDPSLAPPENLTAVKKIAVGDRTILALHENNTLTGWGSDPGAARHTPRAGEVLDIACVGNQNFALVNDGQLLAWNDGPAKRPLPKLTATAIQSARDILAVQLRSGGWIFFTRDPRNTPASPPINRRHLNAAATASVIFSWVYDDDASQTSTSSDPADTPEPVLPTAAQNAIDEVQQRLEELYLERVETPYQESLATLNNYYLQYLEADASVAQSNAQLDTLVAIQAEKERMQNGETVPNEDERETPVALANRRKIYRHTLQSYEEIRIVAEAELNQMYIDKLDLVQADFTRMGDTESALAIRDFRDRFAATHTTPADDGNGEAAIGSTTPQP